MKNIKNKQTVNLIKLLSSLNPLPQIGQSHLGLCTKFSQLRKINSILHLLSYKIMINSPFLMSFRSPLMGCYSPPLDPVHIGTSITSHPVVDAYIDTYAVTGHIFPSRPTQYTWLITPQGRQLNFSLTMTPRNNHTDIVRKVKLDAPEFDGRLESTVFVDWLDKMDEYFEWYNMSRAQRLSMVRIKWVDNAKYFWKIIVRNVNLRLSPPILSWYQMRDTEGKICSSLLHRWFVRSIP